ncbi:MAG: YceI family protein [Solirubrobacteraceae bacterium]|nr:MAG: polyisoprenoid-binding protein [Solirubrobacterales bacterium]
MSTPTAVVSETGLPVGTWQLDPIHSTASFAVRHMGIATFRGRFEQFADASLIVDQLGDAKLVGTVRADSILVKDGALAAHLQSPDFFDVERYPEIRFVSSTIRRDADKLVVDGQLTVKDQTRSVDARGMINGPAEVLGGATKIGITLDTVIDRTEFGLNFNAQLPAGGAAVANEVKLTVELELTLTQGDAQGEMG